MISPDTALGAGVHIPHPELVNLYGCRIGDETRIGSFVEIQRNAVVGARCKISSHSFICEGVVIEDEVFIGHGVMFINDRFPRATTAAGHLQTGNDWELLPTRVMRGASVGSGAVIMGGITIGPGAMVGAGAVVTRDVPGATTVMGVPARIAARIMIAVGVIGFGYWGPNLARNFAELEGTVLRGVSDSSTSRLELARRRYPGCGTYRDHRELIQDNAIDAVAVATPVSTHYPIVMEALAAGKHVLVTKPMAGSVDQAERMIEEAGRRDRVLMVDHTFCYSGAVRRIRELVQRGELGEILYYDSVRVNLGLLQHDVDVIWDLAVHDLAILNHVLAVRPVAVSATGLGHFPGGHADISYVTLFFESDLLAHLHVNWLAPVKVRRTLIGGTRRMVVYDDLEPSEKIKVYDRGISVDGDPESLHRLMVSYRTGDMWAPQVDLTEALRVECRHFLACIEQRLPPETDGASGLEVLRVLEAASLSLKERGRPVQLFRTGA